MGRDSAPRQYPLIVRRLMVALQAYKEVARMCERPERWNVTTFPLIVQQFGQQVKGLSRSQSQRTELEGARAQTHREEMQEMQRARAQRASPSPARIIKPMVTRKRAREDAESQSPSKRAKTGDKDDDDTMDTTP